MDRPFYTLALDEAGSREIMASTLGAMTERSPLYGQWLDQQGEPLGEPFPVPVEAGLGVEVFHDDGPDWQQLPPSLQIDAPLTEDHSRARLQLFEGQRPMVQISLNAMNRFEPLGPPRLTARFGNAGAARELRVFSERFTDFERFQTSVGQLHRHLASRRPFDEDSVRRKLSVRGHYWPSDPALGLFNTPDRPTRLFHGDRSAAWTLLYPHLQLDLPSIVLIDSSKGGGAGGSKATAASPGHLAWASIAEIDNYPWKDVALHELGHAFGLADEYVSNDGLNYSAYAFEGQPNVSSTRDRGVIAWSGQLTTQADADGIDVDTDFSAAERSRAVGVFAGAFYRHDWYRPSPDCLMRKLPNDFCPVCTAALRQKVAELRGH